MTKDEIFILELLLKELDSISKDGYGWSVHDALLAKSFFQDSINTPNPRSQEKARPCGKCQTFDFVPLEYRNQGVPCYHLSLDDSFDPGDSIVETEAEHAITVEQLMRAWLSARISSISTTAH